MQCADFFKPHLAWLSGSPPPPAGQENALHFLMTGNRDESNRFVLFVKGRFLPHPGNLLLTSSPVSGQGGTIKVLFSDRLNGDQPFDMNAPEDDLISLGVPNGPLERRDQSGNIIAKYSTLECRDNGLLLCTSDFTREIVILSFTHVTDPIVII